MNYRVYGCYYDADDLYICTSKRPISFYMDNPDIRVAYIAILWRSWA